MSKTEAMSDEKQNRNAAAPEQANCAVGDSSAWHDCMQHAFEEAANAAEYWEYGGAKNDAEYKMTRKATLEVAKRIRAMARHHGRAYFRKPNKPDSATKARSD